MKRRMLKATVFGLISAFGLASSALAAEGAKIGVSYPWIDNIFYKYETKLVIENLRKDGFSPLQIANANHNLSKQISDIDALVALGAKALVVAPVDDRAVGPVIERAAAQGIPTIGPDIGIGNSHVYVNVTTDGYEMGKMQCENLGPIIKSGKIAYIGGGFADAAGRSRYGGFIDCMKKNFPQIKIVIAEAAWDRRVAADALSTLVIANPDLKAIVLASDSVYLGATLTVLQSNGLLVPAGQNGHIFISSIDGSPDAVNAIRAGQSDVTVAQALPRFAELTAYYVGKALKGEKVVVGPTDHGTTIVNVDGVFSDIIPAILVTKSNVNSQAIWGNLHLD